MPTSIMVGAYRWTIVSGDPTATKKMRKKGKGDEELFGTTTLKTATITIAHDLDAIIERETLLHEVLHACYAVAGNPHHLLTGKGMDHEEVAVATLSPTLFGVLRANPALVSYLNG